MIQVTGTLSIKTIAGKFGNFNVGQLISEIGEFSIRDTLIEEYTEGTYQGVFAISRIFAGSYQTRNRFIIETRAVLNQIWLDGYHEGPVSAESLEVDPLEQEGQFSRQTEQASPVTETVPVIVPIDPVTQREPVSLPDEEICVGKQLFGELWPLGRSVKLDPSVGRVKMREQLAYLKQRDSQGEPQWAFNILDKTWNKVGDYAETEQPLI